MSNTQFGTFEDLLAIASSDFHPILNRLKEIILSVDPDTCEVVRIGEKAATYGVGSKKMSEGYVYLMPHKKWINLGFYKGALLEDNNNLLEGTGKSLRHIKIHSLENANRKEIRELIELAIAERKTALNK